MDDRTQKLLALAGELAGQHTDAGLDKAADLLISAVNQGLENPELLVTAAAYLLQGSRGFTYEVRKQAVRLIEKAVSLAPDDESILETAVHCYVLILNDFPEKSNDIIHLSLKILNLNPDHTEAMITLASHREHPGVKLSLTDSIRMLEWAKEIEPDNIYVTFALARLCLENRNYTKARNLYQEVVASNAPESLETLDAQALLKSLKPRNRHRKYGRN